MTSSPELTVKERYQSCKFFECPRFLTLCDIDENTGKPSFSEGSTAYAAAVLCNNWPLGLSNGECVLPPTEAEETK